MRRISRTSDERGVALITALLATLLATGLMAGMFAALTADQKSHSVDRDQSQAYAAAHAGLEKLTSGLAQLFVTDFSPNANQINVVDGTPPSIPGFSYTEPGGSAGSGYQVTFNADANGNPASTPNADITTGPFTGFKGLITPYTLTVTARSGGGSEVRLRREVQTVAVPVFQFGIFGEKSLSFHAGSAFNFGGRVHTNSHLYLAHGGSGTLTFTDKLTAVGEVVRSQLENTNPITSSGHTGPVSVPMVLGSSSRNLAASEGSVVNGPGSAFVSGWKNLSEVTYNTNIRNYKTGAKRLDLPLVSQGAVPIDLIRRPVVLSNEDTANAPVFLQRYYAQASLRILISDRAADLTGLPGITAGAPIQLTGPGLTAAGYVVGGERTPVAGAAGPGSTLVVAGSTYANPYHQIRVTDTAAGIPAVAKLPAAGIRLNNVPGTTCTGKTASTFTGCTVAAGAAVGQFVTAVLDSGVTVTTQVTALAGANPNRTITVTANGTLPFTHNLMWINERTTNLPTLMSCEGYSDVSPRALTNCRILNSTQAQTTAGRAISTYSLAPAPAAGVPTSLLGGFIKIERQNAAGAWSDVTLELLNLGFAAPNQEGFICGDPSPNAVIRFQRLRDNALAAGPCPYGSDPRDYWPNALFDAREGSFRDLDPGDAVESRMTMGGLMNFVSIDVRNLARWFSGAIGVTGATALNNNGYIVYFSDRRGNHNDAVAGAPETGEYGHEDSINSIAGANSSASNTILEGGEDRNEDGVLQTYGATPSAVALYGATAPFNAASNPLTQITNHPEARVNRQVFFRRALKLFNGGINAGVNNLPVSGLTISTENGVYVQGNYNATATDVNAEPNRPAAIIADTLTILSNNWSDHRSLNSPNDYTLRDSADTGYRFAMIAGKSIAFTKPGWASLGNWGTDGGVHNFMRMLEDWGGRTTSYRGSMVSLYTARQFIGIFKNNANVYTQGNRAFSFDTDFLTPSLLPPGTPMFRDINTLKFRQILRPNQ